jgi:hypothetical protein
MRKPVTLPSSILIGLLLLAGGTALAQDTRGKIYGIVVDPSAAAIVGSQISITNVGTNVTTEATSNNTGYYEVAFLIPGTYRVTAEARGFKRMVRDGIEVRLGSQVKVDLKLDLGTAAETIRVTAEAPLLESNTVSAGRVNDIRLLQDLPIPNANVLLLTKLTPGVQSASQLEDPTVQLHSHNGVSDFKTSGGYGQNEYSLDGTPNMGISRHIAYMPTSEAIEEFRVETGGFDATLGHTLGATVTITSKAGANAFHGTLRELHRQNRWGAASLFERQSYFKQIAQANAAGKTAQAKSLASQPILPSGRDNQFAGAIGGPVRIPKLYDGRNKLFFFFSYAGIRTPSRKFYQATVPSAAERNGDFSGLLSITNASQYQLYDPLTIQPDSSRQGHYVRQPFTGNVIPKSRIVNPAYSAYMKFLPLPNTQVSPAADPVNNLVGYSQDAQVNSYNAYTNRIDYNISERYRVYGRWSYNKWTGTDPQWAGIAASNPLTSSVQARPNLGGSMDLVYTINSSTILDVGVGLNQYQEGNYFPESMKYKASDMNLPSYLDARVSGHTIMPAVTLGGYSVWTGWNGQSAGFAQQNSLSDSESGKADVTFIRGKHTVHAGVDVRQQMQTGMGAAYPAGSFGFTNTYTKRYEDNLTPAGSLGHSLASFQLGDYNSATSDQAANFVYSNPYFGFYLQDAWRINRRLTVNAGLRAEYEFGVRERFNRTLAAADPSATLPITDGALAAYAQNPVPGIASISVKGATQYAGVNGMSNRLWQNSLCWLPRLGVAYQLDNQTVVRGGWGIFVDPLDALTSTGDQTGFSRTTSAVLTNDFGSTWLAGSPAAGVSPMSDPFPVRADGTRFDPPYGSAYGGMAKQGASYTFTPFERLHPIQNRWNIGIQRQIGNSWKVEAFYAGSVTNDIQASQPLSALPGQYWNTTNTRNNALASDLTRQVNNPFYIGNFAGLKTSAPVAYAYMASSSFFTGKTIQKQLLLRAYPNYNGTFSENLNNGTGKTHELDVTLQKRFSSGLTVVGQYTRFYQREKTTYINEFDSGMTWLPGNYGRPHRLNATAIYELPFGKGRRLFRSGPLNWILGGYQLSAIYEYQTGTLLSWGNVFFNGDLSQINTGGRSVTRWFNTDAGFVKDSTQQPASYQARVFPTYVDGLRGDMTNNWNVAMQRSFAIRERCQFNIRLDAMNLGNRTQLNGPNLTPTSSQFGQSTSAANKSRWIQLTGRFQF